MRTKHRGLTAVGNTRLRRGSRCWNGETAVAAPPQRIIVKWRAAATDAETASTSARTTSDMGARYGTTMRSLRRMGTGANVMTLDRELSERDYQQLVRDIGSSPDVEYAEPDRLMRPSSLPTTRTTTCNGITSRLPAGSICRPPGTSAPVAALLSP